MDEEDVVTAENFAQLGAHLLRRTTESSSLNFGRRYRAYFGTNISQIFLAYYQIEKRP